MITLYESSGGWTVEVKNNGQVMYLNRSKYSFQDDNGITWSDIDKAMLEARLLDQQQQAGAINEQQTTDRPYFDKSVLEQHRAERAIVVAPEPTKRDCVTLVYNWIEKRFEVYRGKKS